MPDSDRPNVVVLFADQHRPDVLGCAGDDVVDTPNLDRLAARGVRCSQAHTTSPLCGPARASFLSGLYPHNTHVLDNGGRLPADDETLFSELQDAGYYTAHVGDADYGTAEGVEHLAENEAYMHARGFDYVHETTGPWGTRNMDSYMTDHWAEEGLLEMFREDYERRQEESGYWPSPMPFEEHQDSYIGRRGCEFVEEYDGDDPFALFVGFAGPHDPMDPPEDLFEKYDPDDMDDPLPPVEFGDWVPEEAREFMEANGMAGERQGWWRPNMSDEAAREWRSYYYGKVELIDHWVGEMLDALEARGELEDTVVVYVSDHGETAGDHGTLTKQFFFDPSVRVPLLFSYPERFATSAETDALTEIIDVYATLLDVAGAGEGRTFGESLVPLLEDPTAEDTDREAVFSTVRGHGDEAKTMVATEEHKYALGSDGRGYMLFDREADPGEVENLLGHPDYGDVEADLRERALEFYHRTGTRLYRDGDEDVVYQPGELR